MSELNIPDKLHLCPNDNKWTFNNHISVNDTNKIPNFEYNRWIDGKCFICAYVSKLDDGTLRLIKNNKYEQLQNNIEDDVETCEIDAQKENKDVKSILASLKKFAKSEVTNIKRQDELNPLHLSNVNKSKELIIIPKNKITLNLATARLSVSLKDQNIGEILNITRKLGDSEGLVFAPSWSILIKYKKNEIQFEEYSKLYLKEMLDSYNNYDTREIWNRLLQKTRVIFTCYCSDVSLCHRSLLANYLVELGATYVGEVNIVPTKIEDNKDKVSKPTKKSRNKNNPGQGSLF